MPEMRQVTMSEAMRLLGLSRSTVSRRLKDGTLTGRKHEGKWLIGLPVDAIGVAPDTPVDLREQVIHLTHQVDQLTNQVTQLADERDYLRQQVDRLEGLLESQNVIIQTMQMTKQKALPDPTKRRSWWKRFSGWIDPTADVDGMQG